MLNKLLGKFDGPLFWITLLGCLAAILTGTVNPEGFAAALNSIQAFITTNFTWWYLLVVAGFIVFLIWLFLSKYGEIKLGKDDEEPEYSTFSWIAMLFSCGIGVGFIFWGVAEPLYHYMQTPYLAAPETPEAASVAMQVSLLHWGIHGWVPYVVVGLSMAYSSYRLGKPMKFSSSLYAVLGKGTEGPWGKLVDFLAAFATIAGISTSIGMGVMSIRFGVSHLFGFEMTTGLTVTALLLLIVAYTISAVTGLNRGIKHLSNINVWLAFGVLLFFLFAGPTRFVLNLLTDGLGHYFQNFIFMTFWSDPVNQGSWLGWWTVFYWCWWIAWAPFVGGFIARISKGRTIREFIVGVLFIPFIVTVIWFSIVGGATLHAQINGIVDMWGAIQKDTGSGIYILLTAYPLGQIVSFIVFVNLLTFLVTSADSASFLVAMIMSRGDLEPKTVMKIIWGIVIGLSGVILLVSGGLQALQTVSIVAALPFSIIIIGMLYSLVRGLQSEKSTVSRHSLGKPNIALEPESQNAEA